MTTDPDRPAVPGLERPDAPAGDDDGLFFVPEEHPRVVEPAPVRRVPRRRLGAADDPDRFDAGADAPPPELPRGLDPARDPDRYTPPGQGQSLTDLLGEGAHEGDRDNYQWVAGLLGVLAFLALVAFLFENVLTP